jgi:hypothetical protein
LTADAPPAHETPPAAEAVAGDQASRIVPAQWMPVAPTIAWLAFGSAEDDWDTRFYFGASIWYAAEPSRIVEWLSEIEKDGEFPDGMWPEELSSLERHVTNKAAQNKDFQEAMRLAKQKREAENNEAKAVGQAKPAVSTSLPVLLATHLRETAAQIRGELEGMLSQAREQCEAIWAASDKLRRSIADGEIKAFGLRVNGPDFMNRHEASSPRERVPADVFAAPITITQRGLLPFVQGDGSFGYIAALWSDLIFDSADILKLRPHHGDERHLVPNALPIPQTRPDRGGKNAEHDWRPFNEECRKFLQGFVAKHKNDDPKRKFKEHMRWWASKNMDPKDDPKIPARRTVDRKSNDLFPHLMNEISPKGGPNRT